MARPIATPVTSARQGSRWDDPLTAFLAFVVVPSLALLAIVNGYGHEPNPITVKDKLALTETLHNTGQSKYLFLSLIEADSTNPEYHRGYIESDHKLPRWKRSDAVIDRYRRYARSASDSMRDIGHYGLGLIAYDEDDFAVALRECGQVKNDRLPYVNNLIGTCYRKLLDYPKAAAAYRRELDNNGYLRGATVNLATVYSIMHQDSSLASLADDQRYQPFVRPGIRAYLDIRHGNVPGFIVGQLSRLAAGPLDIATLIVLVIWFGYFALLRGFEPRKIAWMLLMMVAVIAVDMARSAIYDFLPLGHVDLQFEKHFLSSILGIGLVEEAIKVIPVLLVYRFSKRIKEPLDLLTLGCISALGFAVGENLFWAQSDPPSHLIASAVARSIIHLSLTSIALYGILHVLFTGRGHRWRWFAVSFTGAAVLHGLIDYFISLEWHFSSYVILFIAATAFGLMLNAAIGQPPAYQAAADKRLRAMGRWLGFCLAGVVVAQFTFYGLKYGPANINFTLWSMGFIYLPIMIISCMAGYFHSDRPKHDGKRQGSWRGIILPPYSGPNPNDYLRP